MTDAFCCPVCGHEHDIHDIGLYEVYDDGSETELTCVECSTELFILSSATGWQFEVITMKDYMENWWTVDMENGAIIAPRVTATRPIDKPSGCSAQERDDG